MKRIGRNLIAAVAAVGLVAGALSVPAGAAQQNSNPLKGEGVNMKIIANIPRCQECM